VGYPACGGFVLKIKKPAHGVSGISNYISQQVDKNTDWQLPGQKAAVKAFGS